MVGLGETKEEIYQVMDDLRSADVDFLTIGQYLQPSTKHYPLARYAHPDEFEELASRIKPSVFNALETIVEQSDPGESMFVLVEGLLEVHSRLLDAHSGCNLV